MSLDNGWNSMEFARRDGTVMLLHNPEKWRGPMRGYWDTQIKEWSAEHRGLTLGSGKIDDPTCWRPVAIPNKIFPLQLATWR